MGGYSSFMPHGSCYLWNPSLIALHVTSDVVTALAYFSIPFILAYYLAKRRDVAFPHVLLLFIAFIITCGATHALEAWTVWVPSYWLLGFVKAGTAVFSAASAVALARVLPKALKLPSEAEQRKINAELERQINERVAKEISLRKLSAEAIRESEARYRALFENSRDALMTADPASQRFLSANTAALALFRAQSDSEFLARSFAELSPERQPGGLVSAEESTMIMREAMREGSRSFEWSHRRLDGEVFPAEVLLTRMETGGGSILQATVRDITERKKIEKRTAAQAAVSVVLSEAASRDDFATKVLDILCTADGWEVGEIWEIDQARRHLRCVGFWDRSQSSTDEFSLVTREATFAPGAGLPGRVWKDAAPAWIADVTKDSNFPRAVPASQRGIQTAFGVPITVAGTVVGVIAFYDTKVRPLDQPLLDITTTTAGHIGQALARKRAQDSLALSQTQLFQSQKMEAVGRLAGGIAHDFNNVLLAILGYSELLLPTLSGDDSRRRDVAEIIEAANRAARLTKQLLAFSRKQILKPEMLAPNDLVAGVASMLRPLLGENISLSTDLAPTAGNIKADKGQIEQVIMNLAINARDAMPQGGRLKVQTANVELDEEYVRGHMGAIAGSHVMLAVSDSGQGMDQSTLEKLYEPFFTTKGQGKGTGLGLATVHGIVKQSGGHITVHSEVGLGTVFKLYFPRVTEGAGEIAASPVAVPAQKRTETILIVEDDAMVRPILQRFLSAQGYSLLEAADGAEALSLCQAHRGDIHLALIDMVMPGQMGPEVAVSLKKLRPGLKVVFMSGYTDHQGLQDGKGTDFLSKPFNQSELVAKVRQVLGGA